MSDYQVSSSLTKIPMKKIFFLLMLVSISAVAQKVKMNLLAQERIANGRMADREISLFVKGDINVIRKKTEELGGVFKYNAGDIAAIRIHISKITALAAVAEVTRIESNELILRPM